MTPTLYRCRMCTTLVRSKPDELAQHIGHHLVIANKCSIWEFCLYHYWRLTNQL